MAREHVSRVRLASRLLPPLAAALLACITGSDGSPSPSGTTADNPVPTIAALSPESVGAGAPPFTLTVTGSGFVPSSTVFWNGSTLSTTYVDATTLRAQVDSYRVYYAGSAQITVYNPAPAGGTSAAATFVVEPPPPSPVPTLTSVSPASVDAGAPSFTLTVTGSGFVPSSQIVSNGSGYISTTFVDSTTLTGSISSWDLSSPRTVTITVSTPAPGGGTSAPLTLAVKRPEQPGVTVVSLEANDLAWDPYQQKIYASVPSVSPVNPNTVTVIDPFTGALTGSQYVGSEPDRLALSDDGQLLYVALRGASSVERLTVPDLSQDLSIAMGRDPANGPYYASDLRVAPGSPRTLAVSLSTQGSSSWGGGIAIYDDATPRTTQLGGTGASYRYESLQWGTTASALYASSASYGYDLYTFSVDPSGIVLRNTYPNAFSTYGIGVRFDAGTGLLYAEDGRVVDPDTGLLAGTFPVSGYYGRRMVPDSSLGSAFFVSGGDSYYGAHATLNTYDLMHYYPSQSTTLSFVGAPPRRLIRWGVDGLAFLTPEYVVLLRGPIVLPVSATSNPVPTLGSVSPSSATAGSPNLVLAVTGTDFVRGSTVRWNGSERATTFVSPTSLVAYVPASDLAAADAAEITVASPTPGGGSSGAATFTVSP